VKSYHSTIVDSAAIAVEALEIWRSLGCSIAVVTSDVPKKRGWFG
jgi:hypothetical protein